MRHTPHYITESVDEVKRLIRRNPWATIVSNTERGLVATHYPVLLEKDTDDIVILAHVGRPEELELDLGSSELLVIIQGPHGYVSPSWYPEGQFVPTWNHVTAHLYGVPEVLSEDDNLAVLERLVDSFEKRVESPRSLRLDLELSRRIAGGTIGFRMRVTRFDARQKLSQNKPADVLDSVVEALRQPGAYENPALADEMERVRTTR